MPEFGLTAYSENRIAPPSRNPHAPSRSSGGSSGGSAAAVAAGMLPFAPGTDGGGSVRIPAAACGLVGLKPGRGVVASGESSGDPARLVVAGPLARSAADAALMMDALAASSGGRLTAAAVGHEPGPLRIGVTLDSPWSTTFPFTPEPEALDALRAGTDLLEHAGHRISEAAVRYDNRYPDAFTTAWTAAVGSARISPHREALLAPLTRTFRRRAQQRSAAKLNEALAFLRQFQRDTVTQYGQWDLMLMPTLAQTPRPVGWFTGRGPRGRPLARRRVGRGRRRRLPETVRIRAVVLHGQRLRPAGHHHTRALDRRRPGTGPSDGHPAGGSGGLRTAAAPGGGAAGVLTPQQSSEAR